MDVIHVAVRGSPKSIHGMRKGIRSLFRIVVAIDAKCIRKFQLNVDPAEGKGCIGNLDCRTGVRVHEIPRRLVERRALR
jgi:hypothetical protein